MPCGVQPEQSVSDGDLVPLRPLLVAEVGVRDPELFPAAVVQSDLSLVLERFERQSRVAPRLSEVHAYTVVLHRVITHDASCSFENRGVSSWCNTYTSIFLGESGLTRTATRSCRTRKRAIISASPICCDNVYMLTQ